MEDLVTEENEDDFDDDEDGDEKKPSRKRATGPPEDACLDSACWNRKGEAWLEHRKVELLATHGDALLLVRSQYDFNSQHPDTVQIWQNHHSKKGTPGARPARSRRGLPEPRPAP